MNWPLSAYKKNDKHTKLRKSIQEAKTGLELRLLLPMSTSRIRSDMVALSKVPISTTIS